MRGVRVMASGITKMRKAAGFETQVQLSERTGVSRSRIAKLEAGICVPRWDSLQRIAECLKVSVDGILNAFDAK